MSEELVAYTSEELTALYAVMAAGDFPIAAARLEVTIDALTVERDDAVLKLNENEDATSSLQSDWDGQRKELDALTVKCDAMRAVVEAALAYNEVYCDMDGDEDFDSSRHISVRTAHCTACETYIGKQKAAAAMKKEASDGQR